MGDLGVAGTIQTEHVIAEGRIDTAINAWLERNPDAEVIDIKFSTSATRDDWSADALIIYRKENS